jgi:trimeric autotransporter adhesin
VSFSWLSKLNSVNSRNHWQKHIICILSAWIALFPAFAFALPEDPTVQAGSVTFDQVDPNTLNVIQSTNKAIIDWQTFNIQADEATHFQMPSTDSFNLSRVTGGVGTEIFGTLTSNGNLMLLNPNGILFGANSKIDVGGLIATTSNITNSNFMSGNYQFDIPSNVNRTVINRGLINVAQGGLLAFVAPGVENSGIINAQLGQVSLASGKTFTLDLYGDKLVSLGIDSKVLNQVIGPDGQPVSSLIKNGGSIFANGGTVFLEVNAARDVVNQVINMDGLIEAKSAVQENGEIILLGGDEGLVSVTGTLDASGKEEGQTGGEVQVLGEWVALLENAFIDVSGDLGGGTALIGGDYQGKGIVPTSEKTYFHSTAFVTADALSSGDGGKVILWADNATYFYGGISATGGLQSGNGGFVETSGKQYLDFGGRVDVAAYNGIGGTVLLDPVSITILAGTDSNSTGFTAGSDIAELFGDDSAVVGTVLDPTATTGSFAGISGGSTIILQATDFITVSDAFNLATATGSAANNLVMQAGGSININNDLTLDGIGTLHLEADTSHNGGADGTGAINFASGTTTTLGGGLTLIGADFSIVGAITGGANDVAIAQSQSGQAFALGSAGSSLITDTELDQIATTGTITLGQATSAGASGTGSGTLLTAGAITANDFSQANLSLVSGSTVSLGATTLTGNLSVTAGAAITQTGALVVPGTTTISAAGFDVTLADATNNFTGAVAVTGKDVQLVDAGAIDLGASTITGNLAVTATTGGDITDSAAISVGGTSTFTAASGRSVTLDSASTYTGTVAFVGTTLANVTINDSGVFDLAALTLTGNLSVTAGGDVTQSGALAISGTTTVSASGFDVTLGDATNNFVLAVGITGNDVSVVDAGDLVLGASTVGGTYAATATAAGDITNTGALAITGAATFTAATGRSITVANAGNDFSSTVAFVGTGGNLLNVSVLDTTTLDLAALTVGGSLTVSSGAAITQSGILAVTGTSSFTSTGSNSNITLNTFTNALAGAISFSTTGSTGDVVLGNGTTAVDLGTVTVNGDLSVTGTAGITDSGIITVSGTSLFVSNAAITLDSVNAMTGAVSVTHTGATDVAIDNGITALNLGTVGVGQNFSATSGGVISDSGVITVAGNATFVTNVDDVDIVLDSANAITGALTFTTQTTGGTNGADITLNNGSTAISLAAFTTVGNLTLISDAAITLTGLTVNGNLSVTSNSNTIGQSAVLTVSGTSSFTTTTAGNNITLDTFANAFTGAVSFNTNGTADVTIDNDIIALNLGTVTVGQNLVVISGEAITDSGIISVGGTSSFTTDVANKAITLDSTNIMIGAITLSTLGTTGNVTIDNGTQALAIQGTVNGALALTAGAAITDSAALQVTGTSSFTIDSGSNNIALDTSDLEGAITVNTTATSNFTFDNGTQAVILAGGTIDGALSVTTGAAISQTGALAVTGTSSFTSTGTNTNIDLSNTGNNFASAVTLNTTGGATGDVSIDNDTNALALQGTINGSLTVVNGAAITDSAALTVTGTSSFTIDTGSNNIDLDTAALSGAISVSTTGTSNFTLDNTNTAVDFGTVGVTGALSVITGSTIGDTGILTVTGTSSFTTDMNDQAILLDSLNVMTGAVSFSTLGTAGNVTVVNGTTAIDLGTVTVNGALSVTSGGGITDTGITTVTGTSAFITNVNNVNIVLDSANDLQGAITFTTQGTTSDVTLNNGATAISLANFTTEGNLTLTTTNATALDVQAHIVNGNLAITTGGAITQTGALTVSGTSSFTAGAAGAITLGTTTNAFTGAVSLVNSGAADIAIDNGTTALNLGTVTAGQNFSAISGEAITDSGVITVGGTAAFTTNVADKAITLDSQNAVTGQLSFTTSGTGGDVAFDNGVTALALGTITVGGDLALQTNAATTISSAITLTGAGAALSITVDGGNSLDVQAALTTAAGAITLSADDDIIFNAAADLTTSNGNISVTADDDATADAGAGGALTMVDGTVFDATSGTITASSDEDLTLGRMTTTIAGTAITLTSTSGSILDGGDTGGDDLTATSSTIVVTAGGTFGTLANAIEVDSTTLTTSGVSGSLVAVDTTLTDTLSGSSETVGAASVDQTINVVENLVNAVESSNQIQVGSGVSTVAVNIDPSQSGPGPIIVDVYSESFKLVDTKEMGPGISADTGQLNNFWLGEEEEN